MDDHWPWPYWPARWPTSSRRRVRCTLRLASRSVCRKCTCAWRGSPRACAWSTSSTSGKTRDSARSPSARRNPVPGIPAHDEDSAGLITKWRKMIADAGGDTVIITVHAIMLSIQRLLAIVLNMHYRGSILFTIWQEKKLIYMWHREQIK